MSVHGFFKMPFYQVTHNLLLDGDGSASPVLSPQPPGVTQASSHALHYPSDHQLQYQRIMSKPGSSINKEEHAGMYSSCSIELM